MDIRDARPQWIQAFQAAIFELDTAQLPEKMTLAKHAILARMEDLHGFNADSERYELETALQALSHLAPVDGPNRLRIVAGHAL